MRIPIREQLGLLVLLTCLFALAVVTIATVSSLYSPPNQLHPNMTALQWVNNYNFVVDIRYACQSITASPSVLKCDLDFRVLHSQPPCMPAN